MVEVFISFLVLFVVLTIGTHNLSTYRQPLGFSRENLWCLTLGLWELPKEQAAAVLQRMQQRLQALPEVKEMSFVKDAAPYQPQATRYRKDLTVESTVVDQVIQWPVDDRFAKVMKISLAEGRWFRKGDYGGRTQPIVINNQLKEALFGDLSPLGKTITSKEHTFVVIGVVPYYRRAENEREEPGFFSQVTIGDTLKALPSDILIEVKPGTSPEFGEKLAREAALSLGDAGWQYISPGSLQDQREEYLGTDFTQMLLTVIVCFFLIANVVVGLFGVLWQKINRRKAEIGVRRAMGATENKIYLQMIGEVWVMAALSILPGGVLASQFLFFNPFGFELESYLWGIALATITIYVLITLCALYPSRKASQIQPALALHAE